MCGRFTLFFDEQTFIDEFAVKELPLFPPHYNIAPGENIPIITYNAVDNVYEVTLASWGFIPPWAKDIKKVPRPINARAESLTSKPYFRQALAHQRCLIPANGFYEWDKSTKPSTPYRYCFKDNNLFAFAGLWSHWRESEDKDDIKSCTIITTDANKLVSQVHNRMPVIFLKKDYSAWLTPEISTTTLSDLLEPRDIPNLTTYPVSTHVNNPKNDDQKCITPKSLFNKSE